MATDPNDIRLTTHQKHSLAKLADETGTCWSDLIEACLTFAAVQAGIEQADRGDLCPADEVFKRLYQRAHELQQAG